MTGTQYQTAKRDVHAIDLKSLRDQIPAMRSCQEMLAKSVDQLQSGVESATTIYVLNSFQLLAEIHASAVQALAKDRNVTAMVLAQTALGMLVNCIYAAGDPGGDRLTAALRHHLDARRDWIIAWRRADPDDVSAQEQQMNLADYCRLQPWYADAPQWPDLGERADAAGWKDWVYPVLSGAADAQQLQAQSLLNLLETEKQGGPEQVAAAHRYRLAKESSDAMYMEGIALSLFADAIERFAKARQDKVVATMANSTYERLEKLQDRHRQMALKHKNDENIYIRIGG